MSEISTTLALSEVEEHDPDIYWEILDTLEEKQITPEQVGEVEIVELLNGLEIAVRDEEGDDLFILELDPEDFSRRS